MSSEPSRLRVAQPDESKTVQSALVRIETVAKTLDVSPRTARRMWQSGLLIGGVKIGRTLRFNLNEIHQWIAEGCPRRDQWELKKKLARRS